MVAGLVYRKSLKVHNVSRGTASNLMNLDPWKVAGIRETLDNFVQVLLIVTSKFSAGVSITNTEY
jgi:hypothetical protein